MLDIGWSELAVIAVVALLVIGPKDLPFVLRSVGQWIAKARGMAREFQSGVDDMIREAELDELRKKVETGASFDLEKEVKNTIDPGGALEKQMTMDPAPAPGKKPEALPAADYTPPAEEPEAERATEGERKTA